MKLNLLPYNERPSPNRGVRPKFVLIVVGILLIGGVSGATVLKTMERNAMQQEVASARQYRTSLQAQRRAVDELDAAIRRIDQHYEKWQNLQFQASKGVDGRTLEGIIAKASGPLWLESTEAHGSTTLVSGYTRDVASVSRYLHELEQTGLWVTLDSLTSQRPMGLFTFRIRVEGGRQQ